MDWMGWEFAGDFLGVFLSFFKDNHNVKLAVSSYSLFFVTLEHQEDQTLKMWKDVSKYSCIKMATRSNLSAQGEYVHEFLALAMWMLPSTCCWKEKNLPLKDDFKQEFFWPFTW